jgi:hypothetical protein
VEAIGPGVLVLLATLAVQWITGLVIDSRSYVSIGARALASLPVVYLIFRATFPPDQQHEFWRYIGLSRATSQAAEKRSLKTEV